MSFFSLFSQNLISENYIFFDVETTGLYPLANDRIVEIAMIKTSKGNIIDTLDFLINPQIPIPPEVSKINNISSEMVKDSPIFDYNFAQKILKFIDNHILVAHNAAFDLGFLSVEFGRLGITFEQWKAIDTLSIALEIFSGQKNKLENLMRRYNIVPQGSLHRALNDADVLRRVFFELLEESEIRNKAIDQIIKQYGFKGHNLHRAIPAQIRESLIEKKEIKGNYRKRNGDIVQLSLIPKAPVWVNKRWFLLAEEKTTKKLLTLHCNNFIEIFNSNSDCFTTELR